MLKFKEVKLLMAAIQTDQNFNHEIKGKRIRKQLSNIQGIQQELQHQGKIYFVEYILDSFGLTLKCRIVTQKQTANMELKIDHQYPFNRPKLYFSQHQQFGEGKDLLHTILGPENLWGPSLMLTGIIQKLPELVRNIAEFPDQTLWEYHLNQDYSQIDLEEKGVKIFKIDQYQWRFMLKSTKKRIIGLTKDVLLIFRQKSMDHLQLEDWIRIHNIREAKTIIKDRSIQLTVQDGRKNPKIYLGNSQQLEQILQFLDPLQMAERRITNSQKTGNFNKETVIGDYTRLIEHYSMINKEKTQKYVQSMKKILASEFDKSQPQMIENQ